MTIAGLITASTFVYGDELTEEKKAAIAELNKITKADQFAAKMANFVLQQNIDSMQAMDPSVNLRVWEIFKEEYSSFIEEEFVKKGSFLPHIYPVYHKYYTLDEIQELI